MTTTAVRGSLLPLAVDRDSAVPLQRQIYDDLRRLILDRRLAPATRLPSTRELARELAVSRNTVLAAFEQLLAEGYLSGRRGAGTYVSAELPDAAPVAANVMSTVAKPRRRGLSRRGAALAGIVHRRRGHGEPFSLGQPAVDEFPFDVWSRLLARTWRSPGGLAGHGNPAGHPPLRAAIADYLGTARAVRCTAEQVVIVAGAQQAVALAAQILLDPGDEALIEEPGYAGLRGALTAAGLRVTPVPVDAEGIDIDRGAALAPDARFVCVAPSHQYPLGMTMSLARRLALIDWARRQDAWIVEDDYDSEYRYAGRPLAALQGLDETGRVLYVGSFSKVLFPTLRLGYVVVPEDLVDAFCRARAALDDHPSMLAQPALAQFFAEGHFAAHVRRTRRLYAERQEALLDAAGRHLDGLLEVAPDEAGMHLLAGLAPALANRMDDRAAAERLAAAGVTATPLSDYYVGPPDRQGLLLGYAAFDARAIEDAAARARDALSP